MKKVLCAALAAALALNLSGCSGLTIFSNYRRLENIELVRTVTADLADDGVNVSVYGTAGEDNAARMYENTGPSVGVALGELILTPLGREAILSHTEAVLIGEDLAKESVDECLDYVERFSEMRLDTGVLIVRDGTARDLLAGLSGEDTASSDVIAGLGRTVSRTGDGYFFTCREIASSLADNGCALAQCVRGVEEEKLFEARGDLDLEPAGFAVIKDSAVTAFLTEQETLGSLLILGKFRSKDVDLNLDDATVTVSAELAGRDLKPVFDDNGELAGLNINLEFRANVINMKGAVDLLDKDVRAKCEKALTGLLLDAARSALRRGQELEIDFLDLEGYVERAEPIKFQDMSRKWEDIYPSLPVELGGKSVLSRTSDIVDPPEISAKKEDESPWEKLIGSLKDN